MWSHQNSEWSKIMSQQASKKCESQRFICWLSTSVASHNSSIYCTSPSLEGHHRFRHICKCTTYAHHLVKVGHIIFSVYVRETYGDSALQDCVQWLSQCQNKKPKNSEDKFILSLIKVNMYCWKHVKLDLSWRKGATIWKIVMRMENADKPVSMNPFIIVMRTGNWLT